MNTFVISNTFKCHDCNFEKTLKYGEFSANCPYCDRTMDLVKSVTGPSIINNPFSSWDSVKEATKETNSKKFNSLIEKLKAADKTPSSYQIDIFNWILDGTGNGIVKAVPGSGKSTTLVWGSNLVEDPESSLFIAFNKAIVEELKTKLDKKWEVRTFHSMGYKLLNRSFKGKLEIDNYKYNNLVKSELFILLKKVPELLEKYGYHDPFTLEWKSNGEGNQIIKNILHLVNLSRLTQSNNILEISDFYGISLVEIIDLFSLIAQESKQYYQKTGMELLESKINGILRDGAAIYERTGTIDFTDMVSLPLYFNLSYPDKYKWIFIDEAQDLNNAQLYLIKRALKDDGRMLFVGDSYQAIMGFAGATTDSLEIIQKETNAKLLPLNVCYRCPKSHIKLVQAINPDIQWANNAAEGNITTVSAGEITDLVKVDDLIISRKTAPLVSLCIKLILDQKPARLKGKNIAEQLVETLKKIKNMSMLSTVDNYPYLKSKYLEFQTNKLFQLDNNEVLLEILNDTITALDAIYDGFTPITWDDFNNSISFLFNPKNRGINLSTVHRAKGLEAERVWILEPENLPLIWKNQKEWQLEQEMNLKLVALSRSKSDLFFIETENNKK